MMTFDIYDDTEFRITEDGEVITLEDFIMDIHFNKNFTVSWNDLEKIDVPPGKLNEVRKTMRYLYGK